MTHISPDSSSQDSQPNPEQSSTNFELSNEHLTSPIRDFSIEVFSHSNLPDQETLEKLLESFNRVYGDGYQFDELENPQMYIDHHQDSSWFSVVIRDAQGDPVGHASVIRYDDNVAELGRLFIDPSSQGNGLGRILTDTQKAIVDELHDSGLVDVVVVEPVTSHHFSQKLYSAYDLTTSGFFDRRYTDFFAQGHRESVLRLTKILSEDIKAERTVFLPPTLQPIAEQIYAHLGCTRDIQMFAEGARDRTQSSDLNVHEEEFDAFGILSLEPGTARSPLTVVKDTGDALVRGAEYIDVKIDISHPDSLAQVNALRLAGFYFAALEANPSGDFLVMQRLSNDHSSEICPHVSEFFSENAAELVQSLDGTRWISDTGGH